jgi:hypothetical protein
LKEKYSKPYNSKNFKNMVWWKPDGETGWPIDPYTLLPRLYEDVDISACCFENDPVWWSCNDGYAKMRYSEMSDEVNTFVIGLLVFELDALAMVMIANTKF